MYAALRAKPGHPSRRPGWNRRGATHSGEPRGEIPLLRALCGPDGPAALPDVQKHPPGGRQKACTRLWERNRDIQTAGAALGKPVRQPRPEHIPASRAGSGRTRPEQVMTNQGPGRDPRADERRRRGGKPRDGSGVSPRCAPLCSNTHISRPKGPENGVRSDNRAFCGPPRGLIHHCSAFPLLWWAASPTGTDGRAAGHGPGQHADSPLRPAPAGRCAHSREPLAAAWGGTPPPAPGTLTGDPGHAPRGPRNGPATAMARPLEALRGPQRRFSRSGPLPRA